MTDSSHSRPRPRVRRNDWGVLDVPELGAWTPTRSVSVVVPAYDSGRLLPAVLAGLAAQTYPAHLLEVVVVDDGPGELVLPDVRPERTRVVRVEQGWGRANACHRGAVSADGDVLHWLDADMLVEREEVEAQLRWHHLLDHAVVLGQKWFVDPAPVLRLGPASVRAWVAAGTVAELFDGEEKAPHTWIEEVYERTDDLRAAGWFALRTHAGATASVARALYLESGGMDTTLRLGEDIALGARLGEVGAVFVPDRKARSWHLGPTHVMERRDAVNADNDPFHADRTPVLRAKRRPGRGYSLPGVEVVVDLRTGGGQPDVDAVCACVDALLVSTLHDLVVRLVGDWPHGVPGDGGDPRRGVLDDDDRRLRALQATYAGDPRVELVGAVDDGSGSRRAPFRLVLPGVAFAPGPLGLERLVLHLEHTHDGLRVVDLPDGTRARLERTAAFARARRVAEPGEDLDDVVDEVAGREHLTARQAAFRPSAKVRPSIYPRTGGPPVSSDEAWARVDRVRPRPGRPPAGGD